MRRKLTPPSSIKHQAGWTFWSLLFTLSVLVFFAYVGMKLVPVYSANENVKNAMAQSLENVNLSTVTRANIIRSLNSQLYLDGSHQMLDYKTDLVLKRSRQTFTLETNYQRVIPLFYNINLLVEFENVEERALSSR